MDKKTFQSFPNSPPTSPQEIPDRPEFVAVGTRSGRKVHLGSPGKSSSFCGAWPVFKVSNDIQKINCEKCRVNSPGVFRK